MICLKLIFHIDVNSAFLSWSAAEKLKIDPSLDLRTVPSIIGGDRASRHGVVLAKSIPAKAFGIQTGEPVTNALRKCPSLILEPPDHALYRRRSQELMDLLHTYTSDIEQVSIDECFLDFTPIRHRFSSPESAAREIADNVRNTLGFTVNVGISENKLLAKMASDFAKPDRVHTLYREEIPEKMWPLSVRDLFMVGSRSADRLESLGIHTIGELAHTDPAFLESHFKSHGQMMWNYANGIASDSLHTEHQESKNIGNSTTLSSDCKSAEDAKKVLLRLADEVSGRLRKKQLLASTVTVEIKYSSFQACSRQTQLMTPISSSDALYRCACRLFDELWNREPIRLLGIRTAKLQSEHDPIQLSLFDGNSPLLIPPEPEPSSFAGAAGTSDISAGNRASAITEPEPPSPDPEKQRRLDQAMDQIRSKYGKNAVTRGSLLKGRNH